MASNEVKVDDAVVPLNVFVIKLTNGKETKISGPQACDVRDGALLLTGAQGQATIAISAGKWISVNVDAAS